jgi:hypothetical protein
VSIKGKVSRDFEVCFLVALDSPDIATPVGTGSFLKIKSILCQIFRSLALLVFRSEQISAQRANGAHSTPLPGSYLLLFYHTQTAEILLSHQK